jgi:hypothetical protein
MKKQVAGRQRFMCAGNVPDYKCPLSGSPFDESGFHIDHIKELRDDGSNELDNLQALCLMCHTVKTNRRSSEVPKAPKKAKEPKAPKVEPPPAALLPAPKKCYSFWHSGQREDFPDLDQMMKSADQVRAEKKWGDTSGWEYEIRIPIGERIIIQKERFPPLSNPAVRATYKLGPWS